MRISDWSSDVCSSDLYGIVKQSGGYIFADSVPGKGATFTIYLPVHAAGTAAVAAPRQEPKGDLWGSGTVLLVEDEDMVRAVAERSEEHTSELQSLMRISYAVFCLKKKTQHKITHNIKYISPPAPHPKHIHNLNKQQQKR